MYFLQKNNTLSSTDEQADFLPRLTQRQQYKISKNIQNLPLKDIQNTDNSRNTKTQKYPKDYQKYSINKELFEKRRMKKFQFLSQNFQLMNRTLNTFSLRIQQKSSNHRQKYNDLFKNIERSQTKYNKTKKQDWLATHNRTNFTKFNDNQQRIMYRSRKKYFENSISTFNPFIQKTICLSGVFALSRLNSTLTNLFDRGTGKQRLFLIGGMSPQLSMNLHFHEYHPSACQWEKINCQSVNSPQFNLSQHIVLSHQSVIFIIGGITIFPLSNQTKNQRYNIPFISCYNLKNCKWSRINWSTYLRAHAGAVFGHFGIIDGGITQEDKTNSKVFVMDLTKMQAPTLVNYNGLGLSHHKIISTEVFEDKSKSVLKFDGLICFGGKKESGQLCKNLYIMNYDPRPTQLIDKFNKFEWNIIQGVGKMPQPRYMHSMDLLQTKSSIFERKAYCAVLGGIDKNQQVLKDFWLFDLNTLEWTQIILFHNQCSLLQNGIAGHSTTSLKNQIYIFGGYNSERFNYSQFWTINCQNNFKILKKQGKLMVKQAQKCKQRQKCRQKQNQNNKSQFKQVI